MTMQQTEPWTPRLTLAQAAEYAGVSTRTLRRHCLRYDLGDHQGRRGMAHSFTIDALDRYITARNADRGGTYTPPALTLTRAVPDGLPLRWRELLQMSAEGVSRKQMARRLRIERETVDSHMRRILAGLGVESEVQAVAVALRNGEIQ